jgi:hypothetical protein
VFAPGLLYQESVTGSSGSKRAATANNRCQTVRYGRSRYGGVPSGRLPRCGPRDAIARSGRLELHVAYHARLRSRGVGGATCGFYERWGPLMPVLDRRDPVPPRTDLTTARPTRGRAQLGDAHAVS